MRSRATLLTTLGILSFAFPAVGQDGGGALERAQDLVRQFEYREAAAILQDLIVQEPSVEDELTARMLLVLALASVGDEVEAKEEAETLFSRDPGYELPNANRIAPRIRSIFADARRRAQARPPGKVVATVRKSGGGLIVRLTPSSQAALVTTELTVRQPGGEWEPVSDVARRGAVWTARVSGDKALDYYASFKTPSGYTVAEVGSSEAPIEWRDVAPAAGGSAEAEKKSPVGAIVGVSVAAVVVAAAIGVLVARPWDSGVDAAATIQLP